MSDTKTNTIISNSKKLILLLLVAWGNQLYAAYEIRKYTINSGGGELSSSRYQLIASIAQVDANTTISGVRFDLSPGFWKKKQRDSLIFIDGFE